MKKRGKSAESGANWMDTYGDMVTLLLCFFVLLYSISSVDQAKWEMLVKSFNPDAEKVSQIVNDDVPEGEDDVPGSLGEDAFDELYDKLKEAVKEAGLEAQVELFQGDGFTFVTFRDSIFFDGDSSVLKQEGTAILEQFASVLSGSADAIQEIRVLGHTSQASPDYPNEAEPDRMLASARAARVVAYIQEKGMIAPEKLSSAGYGQYRPIAPFDTPENRAKNRRVELLITKTDSVEHRLDEYYQEMNK